MPFTLAHPAAVLPLVRTPLVPSALVCGSVAPDLPYYISLQWIGGDYNLTLTHEVSSVLWLDPLIGSVLLATFHLAAKRPLAALLSPGAAGRAWPAVEGFRWRDAGTLGWTALSLVVGAATHVAWDELGDALGSSWSSRLNLAGSVLGAAVLLGWLAHWWRATAPRPVPAGALLAPRLRTAVLAALAAVAAMTGAVGALTVLPEVQESLREQGLWSPSTVAQYASRTFVVHAGTALVVAGGLYAAGWHLARLAAGRQRTAPPGAR